MLDQAKRIELEKLALEIRIGAVRAIGARGFGHIGGSLSICDVLAVLYGAVMRADPQNPCDPNRDKLVCSKGHAGPAVYAALAAKGYFPADDLDSLNRPGTRLPSHCDKNKTPGIDMTTGSLGQGTSLAAGLALGDKLQGRRSRVFLIVGDGELNEGQVWEAAMFTAAKGLHNLVWIIDDNKKQLDGCTKDILDLGDIGKKFEAFGFETLKLSGHDVDALYEALTQKTEKPLALVLDSVKGKGVAEVECCAANHSMNVAPETAERWIAELRARQCPCGK